MDMSATTFPKVTRRAKHTIDASGVSVGRLASEVSRLLIGKGHVGYAPHLDNGEWVEVHHIARARWTGDKMNLKIYRHYTGYPGGLRERRLRDLWQGKPAWVFRHAVSGMLPKTRLRPAMLKRLTIS